jgi:hypothetical protein
LDVGIVSFGENLSVTVGLADSVENFATLVGDVLTVDDLEEFNDFNDARKVYELFHAL